MRRWRIVPPTPGAAPRGYRRIRGNYFEAEALRPRGVPYGLKKFPTVLSRAPGSGGRRGALEVRWYAAIVLIFQRFRGYRRLWLRLVRGLCFV